MAVPDVVVGRAERDLAGVERRVRARKVVVEPVGVAVEMDVRRVTAVMVVQEKAGARRRDPRDEHGERDRGDGVEPAPAGHSGRVP